MGRIVKFKKLVKVKWWRGNSRLLILASLLVVSVLIQEIRIEETIVEGKYFQSCGGEYQRNCVIDGDTIYYGSVKIRIADIDTPEIFSPKCNNEYNLGMRAKRRMRELLNQGPFALETNFGRDEDSYGRKLRTITRNGRSLGDILVEEGLARPWQGSRMSWC